jgi:hypothetical protein
MIRDPSDGSVKHHPEPLKTKAITAETPLLVTTEITAGSSPVIPSGLPPTTDPKEIEKLNRSRDWMKQRNEGRGR